MHWTCQTIPSMIGTVDEVCIDRQIERTTKFVWFGQFYSHRVLLVYCAWVNSSLEGYSFS